MEPSYIKLGGTLFVPASHKNLEAILEGKKYPQLKSVVIDFEDGLEDDDFALAHKSLGVVLKNIVSKALLIFIRAKGTQHLKELLKIATINKITGFVLAKFSLQNGRDYLNVLEHTNHLIMPSIEGTELFNHLKLHELKELILTNKQKVVLVRFGLEDMLRQLGQRRRCDESIFDFAASSSVIGNFIATFKSVGFGVSGGVYPCFKDTEGFIKDVKRDMREGLFSKTIIHPNQIELIHELYKVEKKEHIEALEIINSQKKVFALNDKMAETLTMTAYSQEILQRAEVYGIR